MSDERRGGDIAIARYVPPVSVPDMRVMAQAMVASKLFGITSESQALTLMWLCQAEGRHPVLAARDYDIIQGKPAKKAEAMMRDFLSAGGTVEWHRLDDDVADATFSHPRGGEVRITWDMERAKQAGLLGKAGDMWRKYPRQMLRSRCVSEGIRTVGPMATSGLYVPEEVGDYEPRARRGMKDVTPPAAEPLDPETGEVIDIARLEHHAREAARRGSDIFRSWIDQRTPSERKALREVSGLSAELNAVARAADAEASQERLRHPSTSTYPPAAPKAPVDPAGIPPAQAEPAGPEIPADGASQPRHRVRPVAKDDLPSAGDLAEMMPDMLGGEPRPAQTHRWSLPTRPTARDWTIFADWIDGKLADGVMPGALRLDNEHALSLLRDARPTLYEEVQERLAH